MAPAWNGDVVLAYKTIIMACIFPAILRKLMESDDKSMTMSFLVS
jgi:hypothetical protein